MRARSKELHLFKQEAASAASHPPFLSLRRMLYMLAALLSVSGLAGAGASAQSVNQAALVVVHGDGRVLTRCIDFTEAQISGLELLQRSGLDLNLEASSMGAAICRLDGEGCTFPQQSCFCQCEGESCVYWSYWRWDNGEWRYSQLGASNSTVSPGGMDGWVWGAGTVDMAQSPPALSFASICAAPTATATATATIAPTATPTPTTVETASISAESTSTATSTNTPTATSTPPAPPSFFTAPTPTNPPTPTLTPSPSPAPPPANLAQEVTAPAPVIDFFVTDRREIHVGETVVLSWRTHNADVVQIQAFGRTVQVESEGSLRLAPPQNTTYQLIAGGPGGVTSTALTVVVRPASQVDGGAASSTQASAPTAPLPPQPPDQAPTEGAPSTTAIEMQAAAPATQSPEIVAPASPTPTVIQTPTLAPVALAPVQRPQSAATPAASTGNDGAESTTSLLLMVVGLVALAGLPLLGIAGFLLLWALRRAE